MHLLRFSAHFIFSTAICFAESASVSGPTLPGIGAAMQEMVAIDYVYVTNWSLWTDLKLLLRTVPVVISRAGI